MNKRQHGAVLIFSLVMLLLLTLVGVNMIQQNRLQFMMAANMQGQTTLFASAENILELAENYIDNKRYANKDNAQCKKTETEQQLIPGPVTEKTELNLSADIIASGVVVEITQTACMSIIDQKELKCTEYDANGWKDTEQYCNQSDPAQCATEVYTLRITAPNSTTGGQRIVESKYAVQCDTYEFSW